MNPRVSILIPCYNQEQYVGRAVESALAQDWPELEVVVGDDASTDGTREAVAPYLSDARVRYFRSEPNLGRVANYHANLFDRATGEWALNLDGDDWLTNEGYVSRAMELAASDPGVRLVFGDQAELDEERGLVKESTCYKNFSPVMDGTDLFLLLARERISLYHLTCVYHRKTAMDLDFYRADIISSDWESLFRLLPGNRVGYVAEVAGVWRGHGVNATAQKDLEQRMANLLSLTSPRDHAVAAGHLSREQADRWFAAMLYRKGFDDAYSLLKRGDAAAYRTYMRRVRELDPNVADRIAITPRAFLKRLKLLVLGKG